MQETRFDAARDLAGAARLLVRLERVLALPAEELQTRAPEVSGWSAAEHAMHLVLACDLSLKNARALSLDAGALVREPADRKPEALAILARGRIPRGVAQSPRFVRPPARVDLDLTRTLLGEVRVALEELAADQAALAAAPRAIPHQLLGDLTGLEWVRFARVHTAHHLVILRDVLRAVEGTRA